MAFRYLLDNPRPRRRHNRAMTSHPFNLFQRHLGGWLDEFFEDLADVPFRSKQVSQNTPSPRLDISEDDDAIQVHAELPGMDEKDISVSLKDHELTIKGEKRQVSEDKKERYHWMERSYGAFERTVRLPDEVNADAVSAKYKNGVLVITLPKIQRREEAGHKIEVTDA